MRLKIKLRQTLLITTLVTLVFSVAFSFYSSSKNLTQGYTEPITPTKQEVISGLPVRLKIPVINVDSAIEYAGVVAGGEMDTPKIPDDVAWFGLGPRPGESGSAVIDGHYGWSHGKRAAFDSLYKLRKGDKIHVESDNGAVVTFVVRETRRYNPASDVSDVFESNDGRSHLNLITCEGVWDKGSQSYSNRLVVFADRE